MALTTTEKNILKTLAYYQALGLSPMSVSEIKKYLFESKNALFFDIQKALEHLQKEDLVAQRYGFWALLNPKKQDISGVGIKKRINNLKQTALKWKLFKKTGAFLPYIPYVRSVSVTGSMALLNSTSYSDIDILLENKKGRIWTTRFLITAISFLLGSRKRRKKRAGKLCFSQHISEDATSFGPADINKIVNNIHVITWGKENNTKNKALIYFKPKKALLLVKGAIETVLDISGLGSFGEKALAKIQIIKIKNNPTQYPAQLPKPSPSSKNLIFYYPKVKSTEKKYTKLLAGIRAQ